MIISQCEPQQKSWSHADSSKQQTQTSTAKSQAQTSTNKFHPDSSKLWTQTSTNKSQAGSSKQQTQTSTNNSHAYLINQAHSKPTVPVTPIVKSNTTLIPTVSHYYSRYKTIQHSHNTTAFSYVPSSHPPYYAPPNFPWPYPNFSSSSYHHYTPYGYQ